MERSECRKTILVVGGSRGIGRFLADELRHEYNISVCGRHIEPINIDGFLSTRCNVRNSIERSWLIKATLKKYGRIDAIIYCAGLFPYDSIIDAKESDLNELYEVMVRGYMFLCQEVIPIMKEQGNGHIINIGSIRGLTVTPNKCAYSAMKRAAISVTESMQIEYGKYGIKATSIHPTTVDTESSRNRYGGKFNHLNLVKEEDILGAVDYLLSLSKKAIVESIFLDGINEQDKDNPQVRPSV